MKFLSALKIITLMLGTASLAASADDLEIYLGTSGEQLTYNPNVLFIMDTSGSMTDRDDTTESRMLRVQNALKQTLGSVTNINAGLMRFSDFGGPVLYPIRPLNDTVVPEIITSISQGSDDAYEINSIVNTTASSLKMSESVSTVTLGLRYQKLNIPRGATITKAYVRFVSSSFNSGATDLTFRGELTGNSTTFAATANNLSSRSKTSNSVVWNTSNDWPISTEAISSPDITSVIQEIVDQSSWCGGNSLNLLIEGTGYTTTSARRSMSYEEGSGQSPQLVIEYDDTVATGCVKGQQTYQVSQQRYNVEERNDGYDATGSELSFDANSNAYVGVIFNRIALPKNAAIANAYLEFTAYQNSPSSLASLTIEGADQDDVGTFNRYSRYTLRNIAKTAGVSWSGIDRWYKNAVYQSPPVTNIVQQIVNRTGWKSGNDMMFILSDFVGIRGTYSYNGQPSGTVKLVIEFEGQATPGQSTTVRDHLISQVESLSANGYTPIVDTLLEATNYYGGFKVDYGLARGTSAVSSSVRRSTRVSNRLTYVGADSVLPSGCTEDNLGAVECVNEYIPAGATYISPVVDRQCQTNNHIVLLSDGEANSNHSVSKIENLLGISCRGSGGEKCGLDLIKNISDADESVIDAKIYTHTIGFATSGAANTFLNDLAINGNGGFYTASNTDDLVKVFQTILKTVKDVNATFVSPGVAVNQLNRLTHNDELYFALFKPAEGTLWPGNLKKYKLDGADILDKNGQNAVDSLTGFFSDNSHSYWSVLADGNDVRNGGAASQMGLPRNIYSFSSPGAIATNGNLVHEDNTNFTVDDLGITSLANASDMRTTLLKWARGVDVRDDDADGLNTDARLQMGDPIHSQPVIVNYSTTDSAVLVATNHGYLHSFNPVTGTENFAIIPRDLLSNLYELYRDSSTFSHVYGLDGDMVLRSVGNSKYLYVGMRRGGRNYYAIDITNKTAPSMVFKIAGGSGDFAKLGQTWSKPTITKVRIGATSKDVLIFGGGYDEDQDSKSVRSADNMGNAVFMVDADTGQLLWSASNADANLNIAAMQYSIPARISVIDRDNDGYADHMYVADTGGQLFRLDIHNGKGVTELVSGGLMADFGGSNEASNRRFYYGPDVTEISLGAEHYYAVALGSGYRAHPLNSVIQDHFYMIKDTGVFTLDAEGNYTLPTTALTTSNLYDATNHLLTSSDTSAQQVEANQFATKQGWMLRLDAGGEKVLASPLILDYQIIFTTYLPASASKSSCAPPSGNSRAYLVELINGNAVTDLNRDGQQQHEDRYAQLKQTGIAPDTKILIEDIIKPIVCLGTECASTVIELDDNGEQKDCNSDFECLAENIYSNFERVQQSSWKTETERP